MLVVDGPGDNCHAEFVGFGDPLGVFEEDLVIIVEH